MNKIFLKNALIGRFFYLHGRSLYRERTRVRNDANKNTFNLSTITILFSLLIFIQHTYAESCVSTHFDEEASIKKIIDGDTVILSDDRHIRLIGINTPEINRDDYELSEDGAIQAKTVLVNLLDKQSDVRLIYGKDRLDRHGRTLAHLYLKNGLNIQARLLEQGLATPLRIPPNLSLADCYYNAALSAKQNKRGLWALPRYKTRNVLSLEGNEKGIYFISGKVERVSESRTSIWINLENNVALRVHKDDLNYFNKNDLMSLQGKTIEASGWLYKRNKQLRMRLRHRHDLKRIN